MEKLESHVAELHIKLRGPLSSESVQQGAKHHRNGTWFYHDFCEGNLLFFLPNNEIMGKIEMAQIYLTFFRSSHKLLTAGHANGATEYARQPVDYMLSV